MPTQAYTLHRTILLLTCIVFAIASVAALAASEYVGTSECKNCHSKEFEAWKNSDHALAMQEATAKSVLGDFSDVTVRFHNIDTRLYKSGDDFMVETLNHEGKKQRYKVSYTFGYSPLQQYLIETERGHIQALNVTWDSRPKTEGGQRWYHLQATENITTEHPFFWTRYFQNWNSRCANCHTTNLQRNYNEADHSYNTQWAEIGVACEACHGPGSDHLARAASDQYSNNDSGFNRPVRQQNNFIFNALSATAINDQAPALSSPKSEHTAKQLEVCAPCHSRRGLIDEFAIGEHFHDHFQLTLLNENTYFSDGQIEDEVFVYGSFAQSKMHDAGVTCTNCHNPHSTELTLPGNAVCLQCHKAETFQNFQHLGHSPESDGAQCVSCHMPSRRYMGVDDRADHSFSIPRPALASALGTPDACASCHSDWPQQTLNEKFTKLYGEERPFPWAEVNHAGRQLNILALRSIMEFANDAEQSDLRRASLLVHAPSFPAQATVEGIQTALNDSSPLVRASAAEAAVFLPAQSRAQLLAPLLNDKTKVVRMAVANQLADAGDFIPSTLQATLQNLLLDYEKTLAISADSPAGQLNIGSYHYRRGNIALASQAYKQALIIEPNFVPALLNLADLLREKGNEAEAKTFIERAINTAPDSAMAHHALGLHFVRTKQMTDALKALDTAQKLDNSIPRHAYVYAIALDSTGKTSAAIDALIGADKRWPNQPELLMALINFMEREGKSAELLPYLSKLSRIAPAHPHVKTLIKKYAS